MAIERTLSIIKPDATERNITGLILARLEGAGLRVIAQKRVWWKKKYHHWSFPAVLQTATTVKTPPRMKMKRKMLRWLWMVPLTL